VLQAIDTIVYLWTPFFSSKNLNYLKIRVSLGECYLRVSHFSAGLYTPLIELIGT
jgi:hypothetical protein